MPSAIDDLTRARTTLHTWRAGQAGRRGLCGGVCSFAKNWTKQQPLETLEIKNFAKQHNGKAVLTKYATHVIAPA